MKSVISFLFLMISSVCLAQNGADWKDMGLKGNVKSLKNQWTYRYKKDGVNFTPWEKQQATIYQFNNSGRYAEFQELKADGTLSYRIVYSYKPKEKKGEQSYFGKDNQPTIKKTMSYDDQGRITELAEYSNDGKKERWYLFTYDAYGNNTERSFYKADGTLGNKTTWMYDVNGNKIDYKLETPGYATSYEKYVVDSKGNRVEETWFDQHYKQTLRFVRVYDAHGNKIEESKYDKDNKFKSKTTWKYEYDKQGNWIKRTQFASDGADFSLDERTIVYH